MQSMAFMRIRTTDAFISFIRTKALSTHIMISVVNFGGNYPQGMTIAERKDVLVQVVHTEIVPDMGSFSRNCFSQIPVNQRSDVHCSKVQ